MLLVLSSLSCRLFHLHLSLYYCYLLRHHCSYRRRRRRHVNVTVTVFVTVVVMLLSSSSSLTPNSSLHIIRRFLLYLSFRNNKKYWIYLQNANNTLLIKLLNEYISGHSFILVQKFSFPLFLPPCRFSISAAPDNLPPSILIEQPTQLIRLLAISSHRTA